MIVRRTSIFPSGRDVIFQKIRKLETLQYIAKPYATFEPEKISSHEGNEHVPVWNHDIMMEIIDDNHTKYTDRVEIGAGWKTVFVWLWANAFYRHRQRKWIRLLENEL